MLIYMFHNDFLQEVDPNIQHAIFNLYFPEKPIQGNYTKSNRPEDVLRAMTKLKYSLLGFVMASRITFKLIRLQCPFVGCHYKFIWIFFFKFPPRFDWAFFYGSLK